MSTLGKRIAEQRKKKKLSQTKFAEKLGVGRSTVAMWETGDREPDVGTIQKLADFFGVTTDYLLGRTDDPEGDSEQYNKELQELLKMIEEAGIIDLYTSRKGDPTAPPTLGLIRDLKIAVQTVMAMRKEEEEEEKRKAEKNQKEASE